MARTKKTKATMDEMVALFDSLWAKNIFNAIVILTEWPGICKEHGWTSEEFDEALDTWQAEKRKSA